MRRLAVGCVIFILFVGAFLLIVGGLARFGIRGPGQFAASLLSRMDGTRVETLIRRPSPDGQFVALANVIYSADSEIGISVQTADGNDSYTILGLVNRGAEEGKIRLDWTGPRTLQVRYTGDPGMVNYEDIRDWRGVHVEYWN